MLLIAVFMTVFMMGRFVVAPLFVEFIALGFVLGILGSGWFVWRGVRAVRRMGVCGWRSPRWWFEVGGVSWILLELAFLTGIASLFVPGGQAAVAWLVPVQSILWLASGVLVVLFFVSSSVGYVLSFVLGRPRRGKAYECVRYFYGLVGGCIVVTFGGMALMPANGFPAAAPFVFLGVAGAAALAAGVVWLVQRRVRLDAGGQT